MNRMMQCQASSPNLATALLGAFETRIEPGTIAFFTVQLRAWSFKR